MTTNLVYSSDDDISTVDIENNHHDYINSCILSNVDAEQHQRNDYITIVVLFLINLLNYIDRFTIAGVLDNVKTFYTLNDTQTGLLQTSFIVVYTIMSPVFGYFGDRRSRKFIIIGGVCFWSLMTLASSFVPPNMFFLFVILRAMVGIGEASYSTIAPTIISDIFVEDLRTKMMAFFYFAIPVGSGLGFMIGYGFSSRFHHWQYALRCSPVLGLLCVILLLCFVQETRRGAAEGGTHLTVSSWSEDVIQLTKNHSFMLVTFGFTCVCFVTGGLAWWAIPYFNAGIDAYQNKTAAYKDYPISIPIIFGAIIIVAGVVGVVVGSESGRRLRKVWPSSDALVCAFGIITSVPFLISAMLLAKNHLALSMVSMFMGEVLLCLNWALVVDMTMCVVIPTRRATGSAYQMILSHAFGDAFSPYIIGVMSDALRGKLHSKYDHLDAEYVALQYALYLNPFILILGGAIFFWSSFFIVRDKKSVIDQIEESKSRYEGVNSLYRPANCQTPPPQIPTSPELEPVA